MRKRLAPLLPYLGVLVTACQDGPGTITAEPPTVDRPGDPAAYAPPSWPLKVGDRITLHRHRELANEFLAAQAYHGLHVVDGVAYGAHFTNEDGALPAESAKNRIVEAHYVYRGHVPARLYEGDDFPPELRGKVPAYPVPPPPYGYGRHGEPMDPEDWEEWRGMSRAEWLAAQQAYEAAMRKVENGR